MLFQQILADNGLRLVVILKSNVACECQINATSLTQRRVK